MNFTTIFAASCVTLSVSIVGGLYVASKVERRLEFSGTPGSAAERQWVATPPFTLIGTDGDRHHVIALIRIRNKEEATRFCKYMPIVRDRLQRFASAVRVADPNDGRPKLNGGTDSLAGDLSEAIGLHGAPRIEIVDGNFPVQKVTKKIPATCRRGKLAA